MKSTRRGSLPVEITVRFDGLDKYADARTLASRNGSICPSSGDPSG